MHLPGTFLPQMLSTDWILKANTYVVASSHTSSSSTLVVLLLLHQRLACS